ncbi:hypothetical protein CUT44_30860 [Streptomyces carminius]|uniref:Large membrane protein n=1 Tax=Streptomyces carminius TaxID=2665496 RepID=A0A2M8LRP4_9ACTN|nr:hypothetical protein [Streptomyces carminius]PJE94599.1 hypothetical protein CUT44_30860 [Streptomyces carminius]
MSTDHTTEAARPRRHRLTTVSVALAVLLAGGGGAYWASTASDGGENARQEAGDRPRPLVLDGYGGHGERRTAAEPGDSPAAPARGGGPVYKAAVPLPDGPGSAPAYRPAGEIGRERAAELAKALEVDGELREKDGTWTAGGSGSRTLTVDAGTGTWSFHGPVPPSAAPGVSGERAEEVAAPVAEALGFEDTELELGPQGRTGRTVTIEPRQDGLPVDGWTTELHLGRPGAVSEGSGRLGGLRKTGDEYPVLSAEDTLAALNERSGRVRPGLLCAPLPDLPDRGAAERKALAEGSPREAPEKPLVTPGSPGSGTTDSGSPGPGADGPGAVGPADGATLEPGAPEPCGPSGKPGKREPVKVTEAVFGLSAYLSQGRPVLVPSWLFEAAPAGGDPYTVAHPAVEPEFLAPSAPPSGDPGGDGGTAAPADPGQEPEKSPRTARYVEEYAPGDRTLTVHFWGGVCHRYDVSAKEGAETVTVRITERPRTPERPCILIAREMTAKVTLEEPVGDRRILDAEGEPLPEGDPDRRSRE